MIITRFNGGEAELFGYQLKAVLSGSMEPTFQTGSIIAVKKFNSETHLDKGDIITFIDESEKLITHRIHRVLESGDETLYETKGDNNDAPDRQLVQSENIVAEYTGFTIPYVGYIIDNIQSRIGQSLLLILPGAFLFGYGVLTIWQIFRELDNKTKRLSNEN